MSENPTPAVKLACRGVWKLYGQDVRARLAEAGKDARAAAAKIREGGGIVAAADVSFDVSEGEIFVIMGLSGSGKSTVIRCLSRLVEPTVGEVIYDGQDLLKCNARELMEIRRRCIGMVFQSFGLLSHLTVQENVEFPLKIRGEAAEAAGERARKMIALVGLEGREEAYPRELSGGQQQRVGIARSLAVEPELWFLDEPFSALDPLIRRQMQDEFLRLQKQLKKTIVFITHDFLEALRLADRIAVMKDGFVEQIGAPEEIVLSPATPYVAEFVHDAPVARVLRARAAMSKPLPPAERPEVSAEETLESAIRLFDTGAEALDVKDGAGKVIGALTPRDLIHALAQSEGGPAEGSKVDADAA